MLLEEYKLQFESPELWFVDETNRPHHTKRISGVIGNKYYLKGIHKVADREDAVFKGQELITRKTVIQYMKTVIKFHATFMLGKPVTLTGEQSVCNTFNDITKAGDYTSVNYRILSNVIKFGDAYEYVYVSDGVIRSKVMDSGDSYPVYDDLGNYLAFIEHWTDAYSNISYWNVFYPERVEHWNNDGAVLKLTGTDVNVCGLPIHYHNFNDDDNFYGESMIDDLKPLLDELEDVFSKLGDAIYINSLNPLNVSIGQRIDSGIPADVTGYVLNLEGGGDFKTVSTTMDYNNIKYYIESLRTMINEVGCIPAVLSNSEVSNISEMSMKMLFHLSTILAMDNEKWLVEGMQKRFGIWRKILALMGVDCKPDIVDIEFNLSAPIADTELIANLCSLKEVGAISLQTMMEQCGYIADAMVEKERIGSEQDQTGVV